MSTETSDSICCSERRPAVALAIGASRPPSLSLKTLCEYPYERIHT
jgi:hypothetical protein